MAPSVKHYQSGIKKYQRKYQGWRKQARRIERRFALEDQLTGSRLDWSGKVDEHGGEDNFNILFSNVSTQAPLLFGRVPQVVVSRTHKDKDPVGRMAATVLERAVIEEISRSGFFYAMEATVLDLLLAGRGTPWCRFESQSQEVSGQKIPINERVYVDGVYWEDFAHSCDRTWEEVEKKGWVARRVMLSRDDGIKRFGEKFRDLPLNARPEQSNENSLVSFDSSYGDEMAEVWELWCARTKSRKFLSLDYIDFLEETPDPYGLEKFFPCPRPAYATTTNRNLIPIPDYLQYERLAEELDVITGRIRRLTEELRLVGVYDASAEGIGRMLDQGNDGTMIPVTNMAGLIGKTGISNTLGGVVQWLPMDQVLKTLLGLYDARDRAKAILFEVSGISDIVRGQVDPREKASQSRLKSEYASLRMDKRRKAIERMAQDVLRIMAEMVAELFTPNTLFEQSGFMQLPELEKADISQIAMTWSSVLKLLKNEKVRDFRITVESDSMMHADVEAEREARNEFLAASGNFLNQAIPMIQAAPEIAPLAAEMMLFTVRGYRAGRTLESRFEELAEKLHLQAQQQEQQGGQEGPSPEEEMAQMEMQMAQQEMQAKMMQDQIKIQMMQMELQAKAEQMGIKLEMDRAQMQQDMQENQIKLATLQGNLEATRQMHQIKLAAAKVQARSTRAKK